MRAEPQSAVKRPTPTGRPVWLFARRMIVQCPPGRDQARWCARVYGAGMPPTEKPIRQSVSLPAGTARRVRTLARTRRTSASRVLVDLIESGLEAKERERLHYLDLLVQLRKSDDRAEQEKLTAELARLTFGA